MRTTIFLMLAFFLGSCNAQAIKGSSKTKKTTMEKFDKKKFDDNKINGEYNFLLEGGARVRQMENVASQEYTEEIKEAVKPFTSIRVFYMDSCTVKVSGTRFYLFPVGIWEYYNRNGTIAKETNWDEGFRITIDNLAKIVLDTEGIDIMKYQRDVDVLRSTTAKPLYIVVYPVGPNNPYEIYNLVIDGVTGKTLEKTISSTKK